MLALLSVGLVSLMALADPVAPAPSSTRSLSPAHDLLLTAPDRRVRVTDARLFSILAEGMTRSRTFASLVTSLNRSDVIVYIETTMTLPKDTMGRLTMLPLAGEYRYLRVKIRNDLSRREAIALIGHELQHALEIADAIEVRDTTEPDQAVRANRTRHQRRARLRYGGGAEYGSAGPARAGGLSDVPAARRSLLAAAEAASREPPAASRLALRCRYVTVTAGQYKLAYRDRDRHVPRLPFALPQS